MQDQSVTTDETQTQSDVEQNNVDENQQQVAGPLDNLTAEQLKDWGRKQAADAARYRKKLAAEKQLREEQLRKEQESQGKYKEMYESERSKNQKLQGGIERGMKVSQLKSALIELGCNPQLVDKAVKHADLSSLESDPDTFKVDSEQVLFEAKRVKEEVPVFFGSTFKGAKDGTPGTVHAPKKSVKNMSDDELDKAYALALSEQINGG
jgi:hypothetical protein